MVISATLRTRESGNVNLSGHSIRVQQGRWGDGAMIPLDRNVEEGVCVLDAPYEFTT